MPLKLPVVPGFDVAGVVAQLGANVRGFQVGDSVYARLDSVGGGAAAEYAVAGQDAVALRPASLDAFEAAAMPLAALTALQALRDKGNLSAGQHVLIVGASGGVGHYAVQIAKSMGARVTGACSTRNLDFVRNIGADNVIDYTQQEHFGTEPTYDMILDCVGTYPYATFAAALKADGTTVTTVPSMGFLLRGLFLRLFSRQRASVIFMRPSGDDLRDLARLVDQGKLRSVVETVFPLDALSVAFENGERGGSRGKIVIDVNAQPIEQALTA